jgi:hypothetical protein
MLIRRGDQQWHVEVVTLDLAEQRRRLFRIHGDEDTVDITDFDQLENLRDG